MRAVHLSLPHLILVRNEGDKELAWDTLTDDEALAQLRSGKSFGTAFDALLELASATKTIRVMLHKHADGYLIRFYTNSECELDYAGIHLIIVLLFALKKVGGEQYRIMIEQLRHLQAPPFEFELPKLPEATGLRLPSGITTQEQQTVAFICDRFTNGSLSRLLVGGVCVPLKMFAGSAMLLRRVRLVVHEPHGGCAGKRGAILASRILRERDPRISSVVMLCHDLLVSGMRRACVELEAADVRVVGHSEAVSHTQADLLIVCDAGPPVSQAFVGFTENNSVEHTVVVTPSRALADYVGFVTFDSRRLGRRLLQTLRYSAYHASTIMSLFICIPTRLRPPPLVTDLPVELSPQELVEVTKIKQCLLRFPEMSGTPDLLHKQLLNECGTRWNVLERFLLTGTDVAVKEPAGGDAVGADQDAECCICSDTVCVATKLSCGHVFCAGCLLEWTAAQRASGTDPTCPSCRAAIAEVRVGTAEIGDDVFFEAPQSPVAALAAELTPHTLVVTSDPAALTSRLEDEVMVPLRKIGLDTPTEKASEIICEFQQKAVVLVVDPSVASLGLDIRPTNVLVASFGDRDCAVANEIVRRSGSGKVKRLKLDNHDRVNKRRLDQLMAEFNS